uniref:Uncharacterized protein n=1 Tax=Arundo donax TaxID=35708 RepID=A0A0A9AI47_ARUDO
MIKSQNIIVFFIFSINHAAIIVRIWICTASNNKTDNDALLFQSS